MDPWQARTTELLLYVFAEKLDDVVSVDVRDKHGVFNGKRGNLHKSLQENFSRHFAFFVDYRL